MPIFIGDVHGKFKQYKDIIREIPNTIQVGDMGIGFKRWPHGEWSINPPYDEMVKAKARFIPGNHDNPEVCRRHTQCIQAGTVEDDMMFCGGAYSIDWKYRVPGFSWWEDEELNDDQFTAITGVYSVAQPACMVTHDCPLSIIPMIHSDHFKDNSRTQIALDKMWQIHKPKVWVFGHHHKSVDMVVEGTRFICLNELEVKEINWLKMEQVHAQDRRLDNG